MQRLFPLLLFAIGLGVLQARPVRADDAAGRELFEKRIRPVLVRHCYECHSAAAKEPKGKLRLDSRAAVRAGGESGPAIVPGKPDESPLIDALKHDGLEMPPGKKLPDDVIGDFVRWVEIGAPDPRDEAATADQAARQTWEAQYQDRIDWWSLQPIVRTAPPEVSDPAWSQNVIDRFVLAKLEEHGLRPARRADSQTLVRRLSFALRGLPPTPDEVAAFANDAAPDAWERLVDRWLADPSFGEHWARHWMDVVRYTDTYGYEWDIPAKGAWRYRDYLVRAFNADVPFDQLVREQIAGDLLENPRRDAQRQINESVLGTMFFQMGEKRHGDSADFDGVHQEMLDNKIDAFSKAFQATTVSCARCHDHKLDAVAQSEYYALGGVFMSSRWITNTADLPERNGALITELKDLKRRLRALLAEEWKRNLAALPGELFRAAEARVVRVDGPAAASSGAAPTGSEQARDEASAWQKLLDSPGAEPPPIESTLHPWWALMQSLKESPEQGIENAWRHLAARYAEERKLRVSRNEAHFRVLVDFSQGVPAGWSVDGAGLRDATQPGEFVVSLEGPGIIERVLPGGLFTNVLSPRLNGALRTPHLRDLDFGHISFECCGGGFSAYRTVVDNAFLTERQQYLTSSDLKWVLLGTFSSAKERRVYIELATKASNPNFPPRVGLGVDLSAEQIRDPKSWFGVTRVVAHNAPFAPVDELARFAPLFAGGVPGDLQAAANRYAGWLQSSVENWSRNQSTGDDVQLISWLLERGLISNRHDAAGHPEIGSLVRRYRELESRLEPPCTVNGMADLDRGEDSRLNIRGEYDQFGPAVPRGYLRMLGEAGRPFDAAGSGRRELAECVADPKNPLTARVFVNRAWHWLFGTGIVATPDDFGHVGDRPSHPELLDELAARFIEQGWSLKKLVRSIVLSETWRQSNETTPEALAADPRNRWLHHAALRRLEAEPIRDAMLRVSGRLEARLYGPSCDPYRTNEDPQKRLFSGPLDGEGRRSLYTKITIMEPPRFLATFNQPTPKIPTGRRDVTSTTAQSLALLNDPFVENQAEYWAGRLIGDGSPAVEARVAVMFRTAFGRSPDEGETARWSRAAADFARLHQVDEAGLMQSLPVWKDVAHAFFNAKEFIYVR